MLTLKLKPLSKEVADLYNNHKQFHEGDAGLDLFFTKDQITKSGTTELIDLGFKSEMVDEFGNNVTYLLKPRSSIFKTPLRQSNTEGVIDAGYRGELKVPVDHILTSSNFVKGCFTETYYDIKQGQRLFQLCSPNMKPLKLVVLKENEELSETERGEGGFGSTGK